MCGIAGIVGAAHDPATVGRMMGAIRHRGPDAFAEWSSLRASLGHARLSIIDVSDAANQPFEKDGLVLCYNGEIYNYRALRDELAARGVAFRTQSDTEVLLEAWRLWGPGCLARLRGMFAFAILDTGSGTSWIVRDRFGIKPLFYYTRPRGGIAFASELKALETAFPGVFTLDRASVAASLVYVWLPEDRCIWQEVRKLPPGGVLTVAPDGSVRLDRYWHPHALLTDPAAQYATEAEARAALGDALEGSVAAHLVADVPVGAFLSGGVDSSLIVAMAARHVRAIECYTIRFPASAAGLEGVVDDGPYAAKVARHLGVSLTAVDIDVNVADLLPMMVAHLDEPIGDSAAINTYLMSRAARTAGIKVLLSGMGADEVLGGYRRHRAALMASSYRRLPQLVRRGIAAAVDRLPASTARRGIVPVRWAKRFLEFADLPEADAYMRSYSYYSGDELGALLGDFGRETHAALRRDHADIYEAGGSDMLERMSFTDVNLFLVALNQAYTDRASMAASTEVRVPFVDPDVIETAFRIPSRMKIRGGRTKAILKRVAEDWLPHDIIHRPKSSFAMPLRAWLKTDLRDMVEDHVLSPAGLAGRDMFASAGLRKLVDDDRAGRADNAQRIWHLVTLEQWFRNHGL